MAEHESTIDWKFIREVAQENAAIRAGLAATVEIELPPGADIRLVVTPTTAGGSSKNGAA